MSGRLTGMSRPPAVSVRRPAPRSGRWWELWGRARPVLRTAVAVGLGGAVTVAINIVALLIAVPVGIMAGELVWSIAITEGALLVGCLVAGAILAVRRRRGLGAGVVLGWVAGYVGLLAIVVALFLLAVVAMVALVALMFIGYALGSL